MNNKKIVKSLISEFYPYAKKSLGFDKNIKIILKDDEENAQNPLARTAFYSPTEDTVTVFITNRHPKDILRSFAHELVHHVQNCRGEFGDDLTTEEGYAQNNDQLREMEREAYEKGNLLLRDYEDMKKKDDIKEEIYKNHDNQRVKLFDDHNEKLYKLLKENAVVNSSVFSPKDTGFGPAMNTDTTVKLPKEIVPVLARWHSGLDDPIYKVALMAKNEKNIPTELLQEAGAEIESIADNVYEEDQKQELQKIIELFRNALQSASDEQVIYQRGR